MTSLPPPDDEKARLRIVPWDPPGRMALGALFGAMAGILVTVPAVHAPLAASVAMGTIVAWLVYAWSGRPLLEADAEGLTARGLFGSRRIAWDEIDDYFIGLHDQATVAAGKKRITWSRDRPFAGDLEDWVTARAKRAKADRFEPLGFRDCDLPRTVGTAGDRWFAGGVLVAGAMYMVWPAGRVLLRGISEWSDLGGEVFAAGIGVLLLYLSMPGFILWLGASELTLALRSRGHGAVLTLNVTGPEFVRRGARHVYAWSELSRVSESSRGIRIDLGEESFQVALGLERQGVLKALRRLAPQASYEAFTVDARAREDLVPVRRDGGVTEYSYRTRFARAHLVFAWVLLVIFGGIFGSAESRSVGDDVIAGGVLAAWALAAAWLVRITRAYLRARIVIDDTTLERIDGPGTLRIPLHQIRRVREVSVGFLEVAYDDTTVTFWAVTTGGRELIERLQARALDPVRRAPLA